MKTGWIDRVAPLVFVLVWSTGFIGARIGTRYAAPFTVLAIRLSIASVALALLTLVYLFLNPDYRICAIGCAIWFDRRVRGDEMKLEARFGDAYRDYKQRVKRWVPFVC